MSASVDLLREGVIKVIPVDGALAGPETEDC
jgi:hypothetical protein